MTEKFIFIFEMLGVIATAASGAMTGIKKHMDMLGVGVLAVTAAMGGGIIRDLILGALPPVAFVRPIYAGTAFAVAAVMFFFHRAFPEHSFQKLHAAVFLYMDAIRTRRVRCQSAFRKPLPCMASSIYFCFLPPVS